nr:chymotrypsin-like protease CTRL-1 [Drosophila takahashii]
MRTSLAWISYLILFLTELGASQFLEEPCGAPPNVGFKIFGGENAKNQEAAWMAAVSNSKRFLCGGTLIHRRFVLTAAHCIFNQNSLQVKLGAYNKTQPTAVFNVIKGIIHRLYRNQLASENDIGLLKLSRSVSYGPNIQPVCIILDKNFKSQVDHTMSFKAFGWGLKKNLQESDILQTIILNRLNPFQCRQSFGLWPSLQQICAGASYGDTCDGDSGGPLINNITVPRIGNLATQLGIVSYGLKGCKGHGVYTDVTSYVDWIEATIKENEDDDASQPRIPLRTPKDQDKWLYRECGGDSIASHLIANIYGIDFKALGVMITDRGFKPICMLAKMGDQRKESSAPFTLFYYVRTYEGLKTFDVSVAIVNSYECSYRIQRTIEANQFCVEAPPGTSQYYGNPGDILGKKVMHKGRERFVMIGIISYGYNNLHVVTNVIRHTGWIDNTVRFN